ncbi:MAG: EamA family transporter [Candidatus Nanopusillus sp.]|jgi:transporter family protein|nr:EamA family transporter [Candidatus Nanopusillus sp.]
MISIPGWFIYALLGAIFAAFSTIFAKIGLQGINSITVTTLRSIIMTFVIFIIFMLEIKDINNLFNLSNKDYIFIILSAIFGALSWIAFFYALKIGEASNVSIVDKSSLLFVILLSILILNEKITIQKAIASILMFIALVLLVI